MKRMTADSEAQNGSTMHPLQITLSVQLWMGHPYQPPAIQGSVREVLGRGGQKEPKSQQMIGKLTFGHSMAPNYQLTAAVVTCTTSKLLKLQHGWRGPRDTPLSGELLHLMVAEGGEAPLLWGCGLMEVGQPQWIARHPRSQGQN